MQRSATSRPECLMRRRADDVDLRVPLAKRTGTIYFGLCYDRGLSHFGPAARSWSLRLTAPNVSITLPGKDSPSGRDCEERNHQSQDRESARLTVPGLLLARAIPALKQIRRRLPTCASNICSWPILLKKSPSIGPGKISLTQVDIYIRFLLASQFDLERPTWRRLSAMRPSAF
jgi:hypothetical protein